MPGQATVNLIAILLLIIGPIILLLKQIIPREMRMWFLGASLFAVLMLLILEHPSLETIGIRNDNLWQACIAYGVFTLFGIIALNIYARMLRKSALASWRSDSHLMGWFIPVSIAQQIIFMGFVLPTFKLVLPLWFAVAATALVFAFMHSFYEEQNTIIPLALFAGVGFATLFSFWPNLLLGCVSHMILNFSAVYLRFFKFKEDHTPLN
jgi:membrane protease YdiL (CAAX protease family)